MGGWNGDRVRAARALLLRPGAICGLCGLPIETVQEGHVDHVIPRGVGGSDTPANLQPAHRLCNLRKGRGMALPIAPPAVIALPSMRGSE